MSAQIIRFPTMNVADARQIIANPDLHDDASVLDACELLLADGDWIDHERARLLHAAIIRSAVADINREGRVRRRLVIRRGRRHIDHADPVGQHLHPLRTEAAQHRPARALAEERGGDARLTVQRIAQRRAKRLDNAFAANRRRIADQFPFQTIRTGRRHNHGLLAQVRFGSVSMGKTGEHRRGGGEEEELFHVEGGSAC